MAGIVTIEGQRKVKKRGSVTLLPDAPTPDVWFPFVSVDDHLLEPPDIFEERVPRAMKDKAPHVTYNFNGESGVPAWRIDDEDHPIAAVNGAVGRPISEWNGAASMFTDFRPGVTDPHQRLLDMDKVGGWASLCFPSITWGFGGRRFAQMKDPEVGLASLRAYNDWMIEEWCAADPDRLIPSQLPWLRGADESARAIYRNADRGFKAVSFSENPTTMGFPSIYSGHWDPFFRACEETGTVINLHVGSSGVILKPDDSSPREVTQALSPLNSLSASVDWIYSRVPIRFPELKIVLSEGGVSWVPMVRERLVRSFRQVDVSDVWTSEDPSPLDLLSRNFWFASLEDPFAFKNIQDVGADNIMIECDYPHPDSTWPFTQSILARDLNHLDTRDVFKICVGNACDLYNIPLPPKSRFENSLRGKEALELL